MHENQVYHELRNMINNINDIPNWAMKGRDLSYDRAIEAINNEWGNPQRVSEAVVTFVFLWNYMAYQSFAPALTITRRLTVWLVCNEDVLNKFRRKNIINICEDFLTTHQSTIVEWYQDLSDTIFEWNRRSQRISAIKALHILCPAFFPLLDNAIAQHYGVDLNNPQNYFNFMLRIRNALQLIPQRDLENFMERYIEVSGVVRSFLKIFDEYNFVYLTHQQM